MDSYFFEKSDLFKQSANSQEPLLESLAFRLKEAWGGLVANNEAEFLMYDVNRLVNEFDSGDEYPPLDEVKLLLLQAHTGCWREIVKWASVYAGLAERSVHKADISGAWQLIASSALVLFQGYKPCSVDAHNNYVSRKGGAARNAQWEGMKEELRKLIQKEIISHRQPFNSKTEAAQYFAPLLNNAAKALGVENIKTSMSSTIKQWFTTDDALSALIMNLISPTPKRRRKS